MSIEIPENFKKHCPIWDNKIKSGKKNVMIYEIINDRELSIFISDACIVGEKWGFTSEYYKKCNICLDLANYIMYDYAHDTGILHAPSFNKHLKEFTDHCDKEHPIIEEDLR